MAAAVKISLVPSELDLALYAGDGVALVFTLNDGDGAPLNLTGAVTAQIRTTKQADVAQADFTADLSQGATGVVTLMLTGQQTADLVEGSSQSQFKGVWDMQWTKNGGEPVTVLQGSITCDPDVTRI
jgi:hypothetical protein